MAASSTTIVDIELIPDEEQGGFTARIPDIPAYGEGETEQEAIDDLKGALQGYVETFGVEDAKSRVSTGIVIRQISIDLSSFSHA